METPLQLLLVEDYEDDMLLLLRVLSEGGYAPWCQRVQTAEAMSRALEQHSWDIIISDYLMPKFSALDALNVMRLKGLDLPFIVVSGAVGEDTAVAVMKAGAHDFLLKDNLTRLVPAIERELREAETRRAKREAEAALHRAYEGLEVLVQQRTAELEAVNQSLRQLAAIVECSDDAIISTSLDWLVVSWNAGAEKLYGYKVEEAMGRSLQQLIKSQHAEAMSLDLAMQQQQIDHQQAIHQRSDGSLVDVFLTISLVKDATGKITGISMIAKDISDRRAIERIKDEFVSIVSHELRTPLTSIRGSLGLLLTGKLGNLTDDGKRFLQIAVNNTDRLVRLINDILDLERLESGKISLTKEICNLADLMSQAVEVMQPIAEKSQITLTLSPLSLPLYVDSDRILQTLTNLLSNAIKFSPTKTTVHLSATLPTNPDAGDELLISVHDQGRGIPPDKLETIFERFHQVDASDSRQKGGTGLGLAICRSIIRQHGGRIWVESRLEQGSTFFIGLPLAMLQRQKISTLSNSDF